MKFRNFFLIVVLLLVAMLTSAFVPARFPFQTGDEVPAAVIAMLPILIGALGVPLVNELKKLLKWTDPVKNLWLTAGASFVLSILALWFSGLILPISTPPDLQKFFFTVLGVATLIYKSWPNKDTEQSKPDPEGEQS
jgi:uncharacterized integral membrane protein